MKTFIFSRLNRKGLSWTLERNRPLFSFAGISQSYLLGENEDEIHARGYLPLHQWTHLALSYDLNSRTVQLFLNGEPDIASSFSSSSVFPLSSPFRLGKADNLDFSIGEIDDFRIYHRVLSNDQIKQIYGLGEGDFHNHTIELSSSGQFELPIAVTARFLKDGSPVELDGSFSDDNTSITSGNASVSSIEKHSDGVYSLVITPDDNSTSAEITLSVLGSSISTAYFLENFVDTTIDLPYEPQTPVFISANQSRWTRGVYSEFLIKTENSLSLNISDSPEWLDFNASTGMLSGIPNDGNSTSITITASNPAFSTQQTHEVLLLDPTQYTAQLELSPTGVLSAETPYDIAGLALRLDASKITEENATVLTSWLDSSGKGRHLDQHRGDPSVTVSEQLDQQKVVSFNGYSQLYSSTDFQSLLNEYTILALARHTGVKNQAVLASVGTNWVFGLGENKSAYWKIGSDILSNSPSSDHDWHLLTGLLDGDGKVEFWRDGFLLFNGTISLNNDARPKRFAVGGAGANRDFAQAEVAEVLLYNRALNSSERRNLEDHLRLKWMSEELEDFPLLVRLSQSQHPEYSLDTFADSNMGGDLRFFDQAGKILPYEMDEWNASSGESTFWVKVDKITPDIKLFAYWGNETNTTLPPTARMVRFGTTMRQSGTFLTSQILLRKTSSHPPMDLQKGMQLE